MCERGREGGVNGEKEGDGDTIFTSESCMGYSIPWGGYVIH